MNGIVVPGGTSVTGAHGNSFGRHRLTHPAISQRVRVKAVKTVVTMPMAKVTAKPLTGPVPSQNSTAAAISVVTLVSTIVASALAKPESIAWITERPARRSSRMRS